MVYDNFSCYPNIFQNEDITKMPLLGNWSFNDFCSSMALRSQENLRLIQVTRSENSDLRVELKEVSERTKRLEAQNLLI